MTPITCHTVASQLSAYLEHRLALKDLVYWAEELMQEGELEVEHFEAIREVISRLGLADVRAFGLTWEDCEELLKLLGYAARVEVVAVA